MTSLHFLYGNEYFLLHYVFLLLFVDVCRLKGDQFVTFIYIDFWFVLYKFYSTRYNSLYIFMLPQYFINILRIFKVNIDFEISIDWIKVAKCGKFTFPSDIFIYKYYRHVIATKTYLNMQVVTFATGW